MSRQDLPVYRAGQAGGSGQRDRGVGDAGGGELLGEFGLARSAVTVSCNPATSPSQPRRRASPIRSSKLTSTAAWLRWRDIAFKGLEGAGMVLAFRGGNERVTQKTDCHTPVADCVQVPPWGSARDGVFALLVYVRRGWRTWVRSSK